MTAKLYELIGRVLNIPASKINDGSSPESIETWNSFNSFVLLDELETQFNIKFTLDEVLDVKTVADIKKHLRNHGVILDE